MGEDSDNEDEEDEEEIVDALVCDKSKIGKGDEDYEIIPVGSGGV